MSACIRADVILGTLFVVLGIEAFLAIMTVGTIRYAKGRGWIQR